MIPNSVSLGIFNSATVGYCFVVYTNDCDAVEPGLQHILIAVTWEIEVNQVSSDKSSKNGLEWSKGVSEFMNEHEQSHTNRIPSHQQSL